MSPISRLSALLFVIALVAAACGDADSAESTSPVEDVEQPPAGSTSASAPSDEPGDQTATDDTAADDTAADDTATDEAAYDFSAVTPIVQSFVDENGLNGAGLIVVDRDDGVVHQEYWGEFAEDRISFVASSSKMVTAGVLMYLQDEGLLDVDAPVADVAPWGAAHPDITPAQLVSNSSGLLGLADGISLPSYLCQYIYTGTMQACAEAIFTGTDDDEGVIPPDTEFRYGGAQWQVAGAVAELASGKSWAELIDEIYVQPCGLETLGYNNHFTQLGGASFSYPEGFDGDVTVLEPSDNPNMEGGMYVTTGDYAELLLMHLREGVCGDEQVLSSESVDEMHADRIAEAYGGSAGNETGYGMGWWIDRPTGRLSDGGAYGSVPWLDLDDGYGAYLVIEAESTLGGELAGELFDPIHDAVVAGR